MISKKTLVASALFFAVSFIYGRPKISYVQTEHFDIIFEEETKESAASIHSVAENYLDDLCRKYNVDSQLRIPVYITAKTQSFNGYFTNYNYNHIVLFDAVPDDTLYTASENIKTTFLHELTHLVTVNTRNRFWKSVDGIAGDIYNPGYYLNMPTFICEGASVFEESINGEGRLNDGFFMHSVRQAKASEKFPSYSDAFGSRNIYPSGKMPYEFGSAFTKFIIEKYGMEKYAEFWYNGINFHRPTVPWVFKKTYGVSLKKEWKEFYDSIDVSDFTKTEGREWDSGLRQKKLHRYTAGGSFENTILVTDEATGSVFLCTVEDEKISGSKKISTTANLSSAKLCANGKFICTKEISMNYPDRKNIARIYDVEKKKWTKIGGTGIYESCAFFIDGKAFVLCVKSQSQKTWFELFSLDDPKNPLDEIHFGEDQIPFSLNSDGDGNVYFILKDGLKFSLCRMKFTEPHVPEDFEKTELENLRVRSLNVTENSDGKTRALFSYVENGGNSIPRLGLAEIDGTETSISLIEKNFDGGIYTPVSAGGAIFYSANFFDEKKIQRLNAGNEAAKKISSSTMKMKFSQLHPDGEKKPDNGISFFEDAAKPFRKIFYHGQSIVPFSILQSYYISPSVYYTDEVDCLGPGNIYPFGITVVKNNPSDTRHLIMSAGFNPVKKAGGLGATFMGKTQSEFLNFTDTFSSIFDKDGFMQMSNDLNLSVEFQTGRISHIVLSDSNFLFFGKNDMNRARQDELDFTDEMIARKNFYVRNIASATYTNIHSTGIKIHEKLGFSVGLNFKNVAAFCADDRKDSMFRGFKNVDDDVMHYHTLYPSATVRLPQILPFENPGYFTFNLPLTLSGSLFATNNNFATYSAEAVLFSWEMQKGLGTIPLFANTITLSALYRGEVVHYGNRPMEILHFFEDLEDVKYMQRNEYVGVKILARLAINSGALASSKTYLNAGYTLLYGTNGNNEGKIKGGLIFSMNTGLF